jgi:hypothetical protein
MACSWFVWDANVPALPNGMAAWGLLSRTGPVAGASPDLFASPHAPSGCGQCEPDFCGCRFYGERR